MLPRSYTNFMATKMTAQPRKSGGTAAAPLQLLGGISPAAFCAHVWHQKPLLIRQAISPSELHSLPDRQALFALAANSGVQSRLVSINEGQWSLKDGPFARVPPLRKAAWTLLVQSVNLHDAAAHALMEKFCFIERARLDDVMVSYATDGGGVGPHFDSYDVFLLQTVGRRRWRISTQNDLSLVDGLPLKILKNFKPAQDFVLEPGDMLYLPPHVAHEGIALGECMTYSIGFRALSHVEVLRGFYEFMADVVQADGRLSNRQDKPATKRALLPAASIDAVTALIAGHQPTRADVIEYLGCTLTEPKPHIVFAAPQRLKKSATRSVRLAPATLALHTRGWFFINGTSWRVKGADASLLIALAEDGALPASALTTASTDMRKQLDEWIQEGWLMTP
jgi:50S ribosomal protein L16 3-hydroxylase